LPTADHLIDRTMGTTCEPFAPTYR